MTYSKRIKKLASLIDENRNVIDIGSDHGILDIYLTLYNKNKCLATDINKHSIKQIKENISKLKLDIDVIQSDGFDNIEIKENPICVIAGMGTSLIKHIIDNSKSKDINTFVIQTNNDYEMLRKYMQKKGYCIIDEIAFIDKKIWYIIIKFKKGHKKYNKIDYALGPILKNKHDDETKKYFNYQIDKYKDILNKIPKRYIFKRIKYIYILNYMKKVGPSL